MYGNGLARVKRTPQLRDNGVQMTIRRHARRRHEDADTSETCSAGASNFGRARDRHTADRKDGYPTCDAARRSQVIQARGGMTGIFRRRLKQGAEDQVISAVRRGRRLADGVNRTAHHRVLSEQQSRGYGADRVAAEVYPVCAGGSGNVDAIVDEHLRCAATGRGEAPGHERGQLPSLEVALTDLNQVDAGSGGRPDELDQPIDSVEARGQATAVGHEADHDCSIVSIVSMRRRSSNSDASSLNPIRRFTTPRPETAPRT